MILRNTEITKEYRNREKEAKQEYSHKAES